MHNGVLNVFYKEKYSNNKSNQFIDNIADNMQENTVYKKENIAVEPVINVNESNQTEEVSIFDKFNI
jgi:hypothetical protein